MNLNDPNLYRIIIFKKTNFYSLPDLVYLRDVFFRFTKDGVKPNLGIQEIFLLSEQEYSTIMRKAPHLKREEIKRHCGHSFSVQGYFRNKQA